MFLRGIVYKASGSSMSSQRQRIPPDSERKLTSPIRRYVSWIFVVIVYQKWSSMRFQTTSIIRWNPMCWRSHFPLPSLLVCSFFWAGSRLWLGSDSFRRLQWCSCSSSRISFGVNRVVGKQDNGGSVITKARINSLKVGLLSMTDQRQWRYPPSGRPTAFR